MCNDNVNPIFQMRTKSHIFSLRMVLPFRFIFFSFFFRVCCMYIYLPCGKTQVFYHFTHIYYNFLKFWIGISNFTCNFSSQVLPLGSKICNFYISIKDSFTIWRWDKILWQIISCIGLQNDSAQHEKWETYFAKAFSMSATHISLSSGDDELQIPLKCKHCGIVKGSFSMRM